MVGPCVGGRHLGGLVTTLCRTAKRVLATRECAPTQHTERTCLRVGGERDKLPRWWTWCCTSSMVVRMWDVRLRVGGHTAKSKREKVNVCIIYRSTTTIKGTWRGMVRNGGCCCLGREWVVQDHPALSSEWRSTQQSWWCSCPACVGVIRSHPPTHARRQLQPTKNKCGWPSALSSRVECKMRVALAEGPSCATRSWCVVAARACTAKCLHGLANGA
jgi:hypothetical protein